MSLNAHLITATTGVFLLGAVIQCAAQEAEGGEKERQIRKLKFQLKASQNRNSILAHNLAASKKRQAELSKSHHDLRLRFAAIGENLLNGGKEAILNAVKNAEVLDKRNRAIEKAAHNMMANMREYLRTAIVADPDSRVRLESSIRELDVALGLRQNPRSQIALGSLQHAKIISIDSESGVLIINAGENQTIRRGMTFTIKRGNRKVAEAVVAETRKVFSGLLTTNLDNSKDLIRVGDIASVKTIER